MAAAEEARQREVAAVREGCEAKLAALQAAQEAALGEHRAASEAALQGAQAELADVMKQAAAALASRPEQGQYIEVSCCPGGILHAACMCTCRPLRPYNTLSLLHGWSGRSLSLCSVLLASCDQDLLQAVERAESYHQAVCQLSAQLAQLHDEKAALSEAVLGLREACRAAGIRADAQASALQAIQPLLQEPPQPAEGASAHPDLTPQSWRGQNPMMLMAAPGPRICLPMPALLLI